MSPKPTPRVRADGSVSWRVQSRADEIRTTDPTATATRPTYTTSTPRRTP